MREAERVVAGPEPAFPTPAVPWRRRCRASPLPAEPSRRSTVREWQAGRTSRPLLTVVSLIDVEPYLPFGRFQKNPFFFYLQDFAGCQGASLGKHVTVKDGHLRGSVVVYHGEPGEPPGLIRRPDSRGIPGGKGTGGKLDPVRFCRGRPGDGGRRLYEAFQTGKKSPRFPRGKRHVLAGKSYQLLLHRGDAGRRHLPEINCRGDRKSVV